MRKATPSTASSQGRVMLILLFFLLVPFRHTQNGLDEFALAIENTELSRRIDFEIQ